MNNNINVSALNNPPDFKNKIAIVTGGGRGLGRACVLGLASAGAHVIAVARTKSDLNEVKSHYPNNIECWTEDVLQDSLYSRIEKLGHLDILVGCAGGNKPQPITEISLDTIDWMLDLNVKSIFRASQSAAKVMLKNGLGTIINISSQMGHIGSPNRTLYCTTKHAVEGLTKALAVELAPHGIRVNAVAPTFIDTPMTKPMFENTAFKETVENNIALGHIGKVEDVAAAVMFLASSNASMIVGESLKVDGGWTAW